MEIEMLNVSIYTQGMQRTWWPEACTNIVTGQYYQSGSGRENVR